MHILSLQVLWVRTSGDLRVIVVLMIGHVGWWRVVACMDFQSSNLIGSCVNYLVQVVAVENNHEIQWLYPLLDR